MDKMEWLAFISYSHLDKEYARWLQDKLEYYKLPSYLKEEYPELPSELRPIFRDETDLTLGFLSQNIKYALCQSLYLIVICSLNTPKSEYVENEVLEFIKTGRSANIIPFIISGTPCECFPNAILNLEQIPLAANINELSRDYAAVKVVSRLLGNIAIDKLWQRYLRSEEEERIRLEEEKRRLQRVESRYLAEKSEALIEEGNTYLARILSIRALPSDPNDKHDRPLVYEAERSLRRAIDREESLDRFFVRKFKGGVYDTSVSPDGLYVALGMWADVMYVGITVVHVLNLHSGKVIDLATSLDFPYGVEKVEFSIDGKYLLAVGFGVLVTWNTDDWDCTKWQFYESFVPVIYSASWVGENSIVFGGWGGKEQHENVVIMLDILQKRYRSYVYPSDNHGTISDIKCSSDLKNIVFCWQDGTVDVFSTEKKELILQLSLSKNAPNVLINPKDSNEIIINYDDDGSLFLVYISSAKYELISGNISSIKAVAYSYSGAMLAYVENNGKVCLLLNNKKTRKIVQTYDEFPEAVLFSNDDSMLITSSKNGTLHICGVTTKKHFIIKDRDPLQMSKLWIYYTNKCRFILACYDKKGNESKVLQWNFASLYDLTNKDVIYSTMGYSGNFLAYTTDNNNLCILDISTNKIIFQKVLQSQCDMWIKDPLVFSPDDKFLAAVLCDGMMSMINIATGSVIYYQIPEYENIRNHYPNIIPGYWAGLIFNNEGNILTVSFDNKLYLWDYAKGSIAIMDLREIVENYQKLICARFNEENDLLILISNRNFEYVLYVVHGDIAESLQSYHELASPTFNGSYLLFRNNNDITIYDTESREIVPHGNIPCSFRSAIISDDGNYLVMDFPGSPKICIWNRLTDNQTWLKYTDSDINVVQKMYFESKSHVFVTVCSENITRWRIDSKYRAIHKETYNNARSLSGSGDSSQCAIIDSKGYIHIKKHLPLNIIISNTLERFKDTTLSQDEKKKYYIED